MTTSGPRPRRGHLWRLAMAAAVCALLAGGLLLWENRRGTPGDPAGFYYAILRDGVELNRAALNDAWKQGGPRYLVVDLSRTGLTEEERGDILRRLGELCPGFTVLDIPMEEDRGAYSLEDLMDRLQAAGHPVGEDRYPVHPVTYRLRSPLPPPEQFGVEPIRVDYLMWWGGWRKRSDAAYIHFPGGWQIYDRGMEYQIS